jgi:hypothetical protein
MALFFLDLPTDNQYTDAWSGGIGIVLFCHQIKLDNKSMMRMFCNKSIIFSRKQKTTTTITVGANALAVLVLSDYLKNQTKV